MNRKTKPFFPSHAIMATRTPITRPEFKAWRTHGQEARRRPADQNWVKEEELPKVSAKLKRDAEMDIGGGEYNKTPEEVKAYQESMELLEQHEKHSLFLFEETRRRVEAKKAADKLIEELKLAKVNFDELPRATLPDFNFSFEELPPLSSIRPASFHRASHLG